MYGAFIAANASLPADILVKQIHAAIHSADFESGFLRRTYDGRSRDGGYGETPLPNCAARDLCRYCHAAAMIGIYGLFAFSVRQRTSEMGIRMALGSSRRDAVALILREALLLAMQALELVSSQLWLLTD